MHVKESLHLIDCRLNFKYKTSVGGYTERMKKKKPQKTNVSNITIYELIEQFFFSPTHFVRTCSQIVFFELNSNR